ncbi:hypothetical protein VTL71DRAFT_8829 [Oculimacula yallundae]|uniref:FAD/NAD(P)-binding domain-containing protein n=1 Tax=Oculimacula yallundae TaxID=86028 RepID=A0ABR4D144_9HELO
MSTHEILILGGHHSGINVAHYLLRHVVPKLTKVTPLTSYHITIVTPNTEFFWNIASPRLIVNETLIPEEKVFLPIAKEFAPYDAALFAFVKGKATALDPESRTVSVSNSQKITYNSLVIATGAHYVSPAWQVNDSEEVSKSEISTLRTALKGGKSVLIAGGGAIGVETAGEVGAQFPKHDTTILSGGERLLPKLLVSNSSAAESRLKAMGVKTVNGVKVSSSTKNADGTTTTTLSDGSSRTVDVYIDATGGKPNSAFLPSSWLNASGHVLTDDKTMRTDKPGIYAIGDVASYSSGSIMDANNAVAPLGTSIGIDLAKAAGKESLFTQKEFKPMKGTQFVPTGPSGGVGQVMGYKMPSLAVWAAKSKSYLVWLAPGAVAGGSVKKP